MPDTANEKSQALKDKLAKNHFVVIGRAGMDFYPEPPGTRIEDGVSFFASLGGSSANICVAINKLGGQSSLVTRVSDDAIGRYCLNQLDAYKIDRTYVKAEGGEFRNSLAVAESRMEDFQAVLYRNGAADFQMNIADVEAVDYTPFAALITTGTVFAAEPSRSAVFRAFELAREVGLPLIFDVDYRPYSWQSAEEAADVYSRAGALCDIIVGNDDEFGFMAGGYDRGFDKACELAASSATVVVYKMGALGAITITPEGQFRTGIFASEALKPVGAGDSFMGGFVSGLAQGHSYEQAVMRGSACASIVVANVGCAPAMPTSDELDAFLTSHPGTTVPELPPALQSRLPAVC